MPVQTSSIVLSIEQRLKAGLDSDATEFRFELKSDGSWSYFETVKQAIKRSGKGKLTRGQLQNIRGQLARASWKLTRAEVTCMAFGVTETKYSVNGKLVWTDEMCGPEILDSASSKRLAAVMKIVNPLMASAK